MKNLVLVLMLLTGLNTLADDTNATVTKPLRYSCKYKASNGKSGKIILDLTETIVPDGISLTGPFFMTLPFVVTNKKTGEIYPQDTLFGHDSFDHSEIQHAEGNGFYLGNTRIGSCRHLSCPRSPRNLAFDMSMMETRQTQGMPFTIYADQTNQGKNTWTYEMWGKFSLYSIDTYISQIISEKGEETTKNVQIKNDGPCVEI